MQSDYVQEKGTVAGEFFLNGLHLGSATIDYSFHGQREATVVPNSTYVNPIIKSEHLNCTLPDKSKWNGYAHIIQRSNRNIITLTLPDGDELFWQHCEIAVTEQGSELHLKVLSSSHP